MFARASGWVSRRLHTKVGYALVFAVLFCLAWVPTLAVLEAAGKSFFWKIDGLSQQYVWFVYTGQWLRDALAAIFVDHSFELPMWTMDSGFGLDVVQAVICTVANPFYAASVFVPEEYAEYAFQFLMLLCIYCAGLAFSAWCSARGVPPSHTLVGALVYVFAGNLVTVFTQPGFLFPVLAFPLALWAADRVFAHKSPLPFVAVMAWTFMFSFYDAYMICIMLVLYCLATFWWRVDVPFGRAGRMRRLAGWVGRFVLYVLLGVLVAGVLFLPQAMALVGSGRLSLERPDDLLYSLSFYINFIMGFTSYTFTGGDAYSGLSALAPLMVVVLVLRRKEHRGLFVSFVVLTVMMCVPFFGRVMNAMEYPTDRWAWAYSLCAAYAVARLLPAMLALGARERRVVVATMAVFVVACLLLPLSGRAKVEALVLAFAVAACLLAGFAGGRTAVAGMVAAAAVSGAVSFTWYVAPGLGDKAKDLVEAGTMWEHHADAGVAGLIAAAEEGGADYDETYRYDRTGSGGSRVHNSNLVTGYMAPDFYNSIYNDGIDELLVSLGLTSTEGANNRFGSLSSRAVLDALLGVRYFACADDNLDMLPYSFQESATREAARVVHGDGRGFPVALYETDQVLPLAFMHYGYITRDEYYRLPIERRQEALLQAAVLENDEVAEDTGVEDVADELAYAAIETPFTVASVDGCLVEDGSVTALHGGASITIRFQSPADAEVYLCLMGLDYRDLELSDVVSGAAWEAMGPVERLKKQLSWALRPRSTNGYLKVWTSGSERASASVFYPNEEDAIYGGARDWVCNLGYTRDGMVEACVVFNFEGIYTFDDVYMAALPMEGFDERVDALQEGAATDVRIDTNRISCSVEADRDGLLFFSVAHSEGWTALVDGREAPILQADFGFMAVPLDAGGHEVVLTYRTPYLVQGAMLSAMGVAGVALLSAWRRRGRRTRNETAGPQGAAADLV